MAFPLSRPYSALSSNGVPVEPAEHEGIDMPGLKSSEIHWVVHSYIGVNDGYLGDMSYRTHREFYSAYCDLRLDVEGFPGKTTREKFLAILEASDPAVQAAILRGVAKKYPAGSEHQRTEAAFRSLLALASRCSEVTAVAPPTLEISSQVVEHALKDAKALLESRGPLSAVDRVHTALHGYLKIACQFHGIEVPADVPTSLVFKLLRTSHPAFCERSTQHEAVSRLLQAMSTVVDALGTVRNRGSLAHANEALLAREDALLAINATHTLIQYLDAKLRVNPGS